MTRSSRAEAPKPSDAPSAKPEASPNATAPAGAARPARPARPARKEWRIKKLARVAMYGVVVSLGLGLVAARSVYGDVKDSAMSLGHELGKMGDVGSKRPLRLNGEPIYVASTTEDIPLGEVLDTAEARCRMDSAGMAAELENLSESVKKQLKFDPKSASAAGVLREERIGRGMVACIARPDGQPQSGISDILARLNAFTATGDLNEIGRLRYIYAETTSTGRTHIVAAWTDGPFNIYRLAPPVGEDAPGNDPRNAPRPPNASRLLTADAEGMPYSVRIYESKSSSDEVLKLYDREMADKGWSPLYGVPGDGGSQRVFGRPGVDLMIFAQPDADRTMVSIIEMRGQ